MTCHRFLLHTDDIFYVPLPTLPVKQFARIVDEGVNKGKLRQVEALQSAKLELGTKRPHEVESSWMTSDSQETPLADFTDQLLQEGRAITRGDLHRQEATEADQAEAAKILLDAEKFAGLEAPHQTPVFSVAAALWAAKAFAWGAGMLVDRAETDVKLPTWIESKAPDALVVSHHWSVDLVFRLGHHLIDRSQKIAPSDPLHEELRRLLAPWPLACVGTDIENPQQNIGVVTGDECLRAIYVDRVMMRQDTGRATSETMTRWIAKVAGAHPELGISRQGE